MDWKWRYGLLNGFGECFWQELAGNVRRITQVLPGVGGGVGFAKILTLGETPDIQAPVQGLVVFGTEPKEAVLPELDRIWGSGRIIPINGRGV